MERKIMINKETFQLILLPTLAVLFSLIPAALASDPQTEGLEVSLGFGQFPAENTCEGADISPMIRIHGCNCSSLALIVEDVDAPSGNFIHWVIWNIPPATIIPAALARNATLTDPFPARQGLNDFGETGYAGPCPPPGKPHRYFFRVFGLDGMLELAAGAAAADLREAMQGRILLEGQAMATFRR